MAPMKNKSKNRGKDPADSESQRININGTSTLADLMTVSVSMKNPRIKMLKKKKKLHTATFVNSSNFCMFSVAFHQTISDKKVNELRSNAAVFFSLIKRRQR